MPTSPTGAVTTMLALAAMLAIPASRAAAQPFHLDDSLRGGTVGNAAGGSFGPDGWTITGAEDRIWYALPRLATGYVEFTLANVTVASLPLPDHEIFAMYEDGYGIGEPIGYSPEFRGNHYKILVRIYGMVEPSRVGAMKLMWGMCPSGAPGYGDCGCGSIFEEPFANPGPWTGTPVRIRLQWGAGQSSLLRDGVEVVDVDWGGMNFGPEELHMMIGSPRNNGSLSAMPIGAVFSDLVVDGEIGAYATCPGPVIPDAGVPIDGGPACAGTAISDVTAASWAPGVYPDPNDLADEGAPGSPLEMVYLKFPAVAGPVSRATLTMTVSNDGSSGGGSGEVCRVDGAPAWDETTLTWGTRPAVSATCSGGARRVAASETVTWDVTSLIVPGGDITLAVVSADGDGAHYLSSEAGGCASGPRLDYVLAPGVDGGPAAETDGGRTGAASDGGGTDAGRSGSFDAGRSGGGGGGSVSPGCGCAVSGGSPRLGLLALALLAGVLTLRRRASRSKRRP